MSGMWSLGIKFGSWNVVRELFSVEATRMVGRARKTMYFQLAILLMVRATNHIFHSAVDRP